MEPQHLDPADLDREYLDSEYLDTEHLDGEYLDFCGQQLDGGIQYLGSRARAGACDDAPGPR